jgi:glycosyltransferase involved in cell wall biosynthesis
MNERRKVLIGIGSYRRPEGLRKLLTSLANQKCLEDVRVEVFVADNDAELSDGLSVCKEMAATFPWPLTAELVKERGISAVRNSVLERARKRGVDFVAMLDDDEAASPDWLHELLATQRGTGAGAVAGPRSFNFERLPSIAVATSGLFSRSDFPAGAIGSIESTSNVLLSTQVLESIGWPSFDQQFGLTGGGDKEYFVRLRKSGVRFAWAPAARAVEDVPVARATPAWVIRRAFRVGNCDVRIAFLHGGATAVAGSLGKAATILLAAPLCVPLMLMPSRRLWIIAKWSRSAGKIAALFGQRYREYAVTSRVRSR